MRRRSRRWTPLVNGRFLGAGGEARRRRRSAGRRSNRNQRWVPAAGGGGGVDRRFTAAAPNRPRELREHLKTGPIKGPLCEGFQSSTIVRRRSPRPTC